MLEFESIFRLNESKKPYQNGDDVINAIKRGEILRKDLPEWIQEAIKPRKQQKNELGEIIESDEDYNKRLEEDQANLDFIKNECNKVCSMINSSFDVKSRVTPNEAISLLLKKSETKEMMQTIQEESGDTLLEIASTGNSQNIKNVPAYKELIEKPYSLEVWHNFEKVAQDYTASVNKRRGKVDDADIDTLYEDNVWGLYVPKTQAADSKLAGGLIPFKTENRYGDESTSTKAQWCTAAEQRYYDRYSNNGNNNFYVIRHFDAEGKCDEAWQAAFSSSNHCEFMDKYDNRNFTFVLENAPDELLDKIVYDYSKEHKSYRLSMLKLKKYMDFFMDDKDSVALLGDNYESYLDQIISMGSDAQLYILDYEIGLYRSIPNFRYQIINLYDYSANINYVDAKKLLTDFENAIKSGEIIVDGSKHGIDILCFYHSRNECKKYSNYLKEKKLNSKYVTFNMFLNYSYSSTPMLIEYSKACENGEINPDIISFRTYTESPADCVKFMGLCKNGIVDQEFVSYNGYHGHPKIALELSNLHVGQHVDFDNAKIFADIVGRTQKETAKRNLLEEYASRPAVRSYVKAVCEGKVNSTYIDYSTWKIALQKINFMNNILTYSSNVDSGVIDPKLIPFKLFNKANGSVENAVNYINFVKEGKIDPAITPYEYVYDEEHLKYAVMFNEEVKEGKLLPDSSFNSFVWAKSDTSEDGTWKIDYIYRYVELVKQRLIDKDLISESDFRWTSDNPQVEQDMISFCKARKDGLINKTIEYDCYCTLHDNQTFTSLAIEYSNLINKGKIVEDRISIRDFNEHPQEAQDYSATVLEGGTFESDFYSYLRSLEMNRYNDLVAKGVLDADIVKEQDFKSNPQYAIDYMNKVRAGDIDPNLISCGKDWYYKNKGSYINNPDKALEYCKYVKLGQIKSTDLSFSFFVDKYEAIKEFYNLKANGSIDPKIVTLKTFCEYEQNRLIAVPYCNAVKEGKIDKKLVNFREMCNSLMRADDGNIDVNLTISNAIEYCRIIKANNINVNSNRSFKLSHCAWSVKDGDFERFCNGIATGKLPPDISLWDYEYRLKESIFRFIYKKCFNE